jgi:alanine racemase
MAVVKANGYGHGMTQAAKAAFKGGAAWLAVARLEEALALREAGFDTNILVMGYTPPARIVHCCRAKYPRGSV